MGLLDALDTLVKEFVSWECKILFNFSLVSSKFPDGIDLYDDIGETAYFVFT